MIVVDNVDDASHKTFFFHSNKKVSKSICILLLTCNLYCVTQKEVLSYMYLLTWHQTTCTYKKSSKVLRIGISSNIKVNGTIILGITAPNWDYLFIIAIKKEQKVDVEKSTWVCNSCTFGISKSFQQKKGYLSCIKGGNTWWIEKKMIGQNWIRRSNFYKRMPTYFQHMKPPISKLCTLNYLLLCSICLEGKMADFQLIFFHAQLNGWPYQILSASFGTFVSSSSYLIKETGGRGIRHP